MALAAVSGQTGGEVDVPQRGKPAKVQIGDRYGWRTKYSKNHHKAVSQ